MKNIIKFIIITLITFAVSIGIVGVTILSGIVTSFFTDCFGFIGGFGIYLLILSIINSILIYLLERKPAKER